MRIAFAGSQSVGKTTLIGDLLEVLPGYRAHDEPIRAIALATGTAPPAVPTMDAERRLIEFGCQRMLAEPADGDVLYDRSPIDAYAHAILSMETGGDVVPGFLAEMLPLVVRSLQACDCLVLVPIEDHVVDEDDGFRYLDGQGRMRFESIMVDLLESPCGPAARAGVAVARVRGDRRCRVDQVRRLT